MLHVIAKLSTSLGIVIFGLGSGYFGTAAYYERHPQSVAQSGEMNGKTTTIGWEKRNELLAITPWENWKAWLNRERQVKKDIVSESPESTEFKSLKTSVSGSSAESNAVKKACASVYTKSSSDSEKSKLETDISKYCGLQYPKPATSTAPAV